MKKLYVLTLIAFVGSLSVNAQLARSNKGTIQKNNDVRQNSTVARHQQSSVVSPAAIIWSDDFSNAANWSMTHETASDDWVIGTTGPSGSFPIDPIMSATALNGYAMFDSDLLCSGDQIANLTTVNPIDLSANPAVRLSFSQYYRRYYDSTYVFVSTDNTNWTKFEVNGNLTVNQFSANDDFSVNPEILNVDISSVAGGQATVYIRFQFYSPNSLDSVNAGCGYSWMIDDVSISDIPGVDGAVMTEAYAGEYSELPLLQAQAFKLRGKIINNGGTAITGATITFNVFDAFSNPVHADVSAASGNLNPGDTSGYLEPATGYTPMDTGLYIIQQISTVTGDTSMSNDTAYAFVYVNDSTYARDYTALDVSGYLGGFGFNGLVGTLGQMYHVYQSSQFTSATFFLDAPTLGDECRIDVYSVTAGLPDQILGSSANYTITAADTGGAFITLPLTTPVNVTAGMDYFVAINQLDTNNITIGASSQIWTPATCFFMVGATPWTDVGTQQELELILRVNNPSATLVGVNEVAKSLDMSVYPNPTSGVLYIMANENEKNVSIELYNTIGEKVKSFSYDSFQNGQVDISDLSAGVYTLQINSDNGTLTRSIVRN